MRCREAVLNKSGKKRKVFGCVCRPKRENEYKQGHIRYTLPHMDGPSRDLQLGLSSPKIGLPRRHALTSTTNGDPYAIQRRRHRHRPPPPGGLSFRAHSFALLPGPPTATRLLASSAAAPLSFSRRAELRSVRTRIVLACAGNFSLLLRMDGFSRSFRTRTFDLLLS
jgi:hypothetical protein